MSFGSCAEACPQKFLHCTDSFKVDKEKVRLYVSLLLILCLVLLQVPKCFGLVQIFLRQTKNLFKYCGSHKIFSPDKKIIFGFCASTKVFEEPLNQCCTEGAIFTFVRSRMFGPDKLRPLAVGRSRSRRIKKNKTYVIKVLIRNHSN